MKLIWIDDDSYGVLAVIERKLRREGFSVERFKFFEEAEEFIKKIQQPSYTFLIDFILPTRETKVAPFLGLNIAEIILEKKFSFITFLSVVAESDVIKDLAKLKKLYPDFKYLYINKADLIEPDMFKELIEKLNELSNQLKNENENSGRGEEILNDE